jgi:hypothetical protein
MQLSTEVTLPKNYAPKFPAKCIVCHGTPDSTVKIAHNSQNALLTFLIPILWMFGWSRVEIPICKECKPRYRLQRWTRELICWAIIIGGFIFIAPHFKDWPRLTRNIVVLALVFCGVAIWALAEVIWLRIFDTTARSDSIDYEFASPHYAAEFHELNQTHILKSDLQ